MSSKTVSSELAVVLVSSAQTMVPLAAGFSYSSRAPYAVRILFRVGLGEPVEWACARELLAAGLKAREGAGDITVWPSTDANGFVLHIELSSPDGWAHVQAAAREISDFLRRTYRLVPAGTESDHLDIDAGLNDLLRGAP